MEKKKSPNSLLLAAIYTEFLGSNVLPYIHTHTLSLSLLLNLVVNNLFIAFGFLSLLFRAYAFSGHLKAGEKRKLKWVLVPNMHHDLISY